MGAFNRLIQQIQDSRTNRSSAFPATWEGPFDIEIKEEGVTHRFERSKNAEEVQAFNDKIQAWGSSVKSDLSSSIGQFVKNDKKLSRSLKNNYFYDTGEIYRIGFSFKREGIFIHKGVGKGYVMENGTVVKTSKAEGFNRHPKPWFNPVIEAHIKELEEIIHSYAENAIINTLRIYIR